MSEVDWRKEYLDLWHVSRNLQIALAADIRGNLKKRKADQVIETFGRQLQDLMLRIPDDELKHKTESESGTGDEKGSGGD